jgi:hypothetical protein
MLNPFPAGVRALIPFALFDFCREEPPIDFPSASQFAQMTAPETDFFATRSQCRPSYARLVAAEVHPAFVLWLSSINPPLPICFFLAAEGAGCFCFCALELRGRFKESFFSLQSSPQPIIQFGCCLSFSIVCGSL